MSIQESARFTTGPQTSRVNVLDKETLMRSESRKYSLPKGNETIYSFGTLANFIGCNVDDIYSATTGAGKDKAIVTLRSGLQKEVPFVYLQPELVRVVKLFDRGVQLIRPGDLIAKTWADSHGIAYEQPVTETL